MHGQIFSRELGGISRHTNKGHSVRWQTPRPTTEAFLERLETASSDMANLTKYSQGLPIACQFGRGSRSYLCAVTNEEGRCRSFDTRPRTRVHQEIPRVHYWQAHNNAVFDYTWINDDNHCLTAAGDQMVVLWDVATSQRITTLVGHQCSVRSVASCPGSPAQFASGARDGHIMLWDLRVNKKRNFTNYPVKSIKYAHSLATRANLRRHRRIHRAAGPKGVMDSQQSVTCVLYQSENVLISSGANDGCVKFWDTRKWYTNSATSLPQPLHTFQYPGLMRRLKDVACRVKGIVTMCMDPWKSQLFVTYTDSKVCRFELAGTDREPEEYVYAGHRNDTFFVRCAVSPDGKYLLSGSGRNTGVIWEVAQPEKRPVFLIGHSEDVSAVDWCPNDVCKLATLSDDMSLRVWRPDPRERGVEDPSILGFAFSSGIGKVCRRQCQVDIVQDEFPFSLPVPGEAASPSSASPSSASSAERLSPAQQRSPGQSPAPRRWPEPSMRQVFWASCLTPRRSPRKLTKDASSVPPPRSPLVGRGPPQPRACTCGRGKGEGKERITADGESDQHLKGRSPQSGCVCDSAESSPCTPKNASSSSSLCFGSYALRSSLRDSEPLPSSSAGEEQSPPLRRTPRKLTGGGSSQDCPSSREAFSPRACSCRSPHGAADSPQAGGSRVKSPGPSPRQGGRRKGLTPVKSPRKLLVPARSPHKGATSTPVSSKPRRQLFSSPTAGLPNKLLDPQPKAATPPETPPQRKLDWLTSYRLSKLGTPESPKQEASPGGVLPSPKSGVGESPLSGKKDGQRNGAPKRKLAGMAEQQAEDTTPGKRKKPDRTPTPRPYRRRSNAARSGSSSRTPNRRASLESPKTPTSMSIKRYLQ